MEGLGHRHVAAGRVLGHVCGDPADDDPPGVRLPGRHDRDTRRHGVAQRVALGDERPGHCARRHPWLGEDLDRRTECRPTIARNVYPDLARAIEVVVHQDDLGPGGALSGQDRCRDPVAVDPERRAARRALRQRALAVGPARALVRGLPHVCLERRDPLAPGEVAEVDSIRLVGREAVVAAARVGRRDLAPALAPVGREVGDRAALGSGDVQAPLRVRDDGRFAAVDADIHEPVTGRAGSTAKCVGHEQAGEEQDCRHRGRCTAQHRISSREAHDGDVRFRNRSARGKIAPRIVWENELLPGGPCSLVAFRAALVIEGSSGRRWILPSGIDKGLVKRGSRRVESPSVGLSRLDRPTVMFGRSWSGMDGRSGTSRNCSVFPDVQELGGRGTRQAALRQRSKVG